MIRSRPLRSFSLSLLASLLLVTAAANASETAMLQPLLLTASVNGRSAEEAQLFVRDDDGRIYVSENFLRRSKLRVPSEGATDYEGEKFFLLGPALQIAGEISDADQSIALTAPAELFEKQTASFAAYDAMDMTAPGKGAFFNYDLFFERNQDGSGASGAFELGLFHPLGVGSSRFVANLGSGRRTLTRLDTNWVMDRPGSMTSLRFGDGISGGTASAAPVRFAGVQYTTNFATQPGFVTMPLRSVSGSAAVPSVIDLYVNNVLQGSREVEPGPFDISGVPLQSGGGNIQLVVRDLLGRQVVSDQNYYASSQLLRKGLHAFSYEAGFLRRNFGIKSNDYGALIASVTHRYGISDSLTSETVVQATRASQVAGTGLSLVLGDLGLVSAAANFSNSNRGTGSNVSLALERRVDGPSFGLRTELASRNYAQVGTGEEERRPKSNTQVFVDVPFFAGTVGLNYIRRDNRADAAGQAVEDESLAGISASMSLGRFGSVQLYARRSSIGPGKTVLGGYLAMPLGGGRSSGASMEYRRGQRLATWSMQRSLPPGEGYGYRMSASAGAIKGANGAFSFNSGAASLGVEVARAGKSTGVRMSAAGAVGLLGGELFASRRLGDSFAAVQLKGMKGVRVYADNQLVGTTDRAGNLIIPSMRAYERNSIRLDDSDFPLDVQIEKTELAVRPFARAGTLLQFAVRRDRGALLKIQLEDGTSLPAGAMVYAAGEKAGHVTASKGEVYVPNLSGRTSLEAIWGTRACRFEVAIPESNDPQPRIDGLICRIGAEAKLIAHR
jgi:outer membrane usher protein